MVSARAMTAAARKSPSARRGSSGHSLPYRVAAVVAGALAMAAASRVAIPIGPVPITLQSYALFVLAGVFGGEVTLGAVLAWLAAAAFGWPVLAEGASGWLALSGRTAGFLAGMAVAGWACGRMAERNRGWISMTGLFLGGHAIVLGLGWAWLVFHYHQPIQGAFRTAVLPFLLGAAIKSLAATATVRLVAR
jgi:biotin transport system substrate-specific component